MCLRKFLPATLGILGCIGSVFISSCSDDDTEFRYVPAVTSPIIDASGESLEAVLEWHNSSPSTPTLKLFDVYLGTSPENLELVATDLLEEQFRCSALQMNTTYYWQVVARGEGKSKRGEIGKFKTGNELQKLKVGDKTIMVYPGEFSHPDRTSLTSYVMNVKSGADSWDDGRSNTDAIREYYGGKKSIGWGMAADLCEDLVAYGYYDWYLPAILEVDAVVAANNLVKYESQRYWSSTEQPDSPFRMMIRANMYNPLTGFADEDKAAYENLKCRCVRAE